MSVAANHVYQFTKLNKWADYAFCNMQNIEAREQNDIGLEIWLVAKRGIIGKWCEDTQLGYIEEYRSDERLAKQA